MVDRRPGGKRRRDETPLSDNGSTEPIAKVKRIRKAPTQDNEVEQFLHSDRNVINMKTAVNWARIEAQLPGPNQVTRTVEWAHEGSLIVLSHSASEWINRLFHGNPPGVMVKDSANVRLALDKTQGTYLIGYISNHSWERRLISPDEVKYFEERGKDLSDVPRDSEDQPYLLFPGKTQNLDRFIVNQMRLSDELDVFKKTRDAVAALQQGYDNAARALFSISLPYNYASTSQAATRHVPPPLRAWPPVPAAASSSQPFNAAQSRPTQSMMRTNPSNASRRNVPPDAVGGVIQNNQFGFNGTNNNRPISNRVMPAPAGMQRHLVPQVNNVSNFNGGNYVGQLNVAHMAPVQFAARYMPEPQPVQPFNDFNLNPGPNNYEADDESDDMYVPELPPSVEPSCHTPGPITQPLETEHTALHVVAPPLDAAEVQEYGQNTFAPTMTAATATGSANELYDPNQLFDFSGMASGSVGNAVNGSSTTGFVNYDFSTADHAQNFEGDFSNWATGSFQ